MKKISMRQILAKLPDTVALWADKNNTPFLPWEKPANAHPILVKAGVKGYWPVTPKLDVDHWNSTAGDNGTPVTKAQIAAMLEASVFGFDCPIADVDQYDENGKLKAAENQKVTVQEAADEVVRLVGGDRCSP